MTDPASDVASRKKPTQKGDSDDANTAEEHGVDDEQPESFKAYLEYNRILRTWFVAFGIGGPALFLVNEDIANRLVEHGYLRAVVICFLLGASAQVLGALINKVGNWAVYYGSVEPEFHDTKRYALAEWLVKQFWIDVCFDVITVLTFGAAVWWMLTLFSSAG